MRYLEEIVKPTIAAFEQGPASVRRAFLACVATYHAVDYLDYPKEVFRRKEFITQSEDFRIVDDVGHAFMHVATGKRTKNLRADQVISRPSCAAGQLALGVSRVSDAVGGVTVRGKEDVDLVQALRRTVEFLHSKMVR